MKWLYRICRLFRKPKCAHHWHDLEKATYKYVIGGGTVFIYIQKCRKCGDLKSFRIG